MTTGQHSALGRMLERVAADDVTFEGLVSFFRRHPLPPREDPEPDLWRRVNADPDTGIGPGSWDEVSFAHVEGRISDEQYSTLVRALMEAQTPAPESGVVCTGEGDPGEP